MESFSLKKLAIAALFVGLSTAQTNARTQGKMSTLNSPSGITGIKSVPPQGNVVIGGYNYVDGDGNTYLGSYNQNLGNSNFV